MTIDSSRRMLIAAGVFMMLALFQVFLLIRYIDRLPGDSLGIWLNGITIVLFLVASVKLYLTWRVQRNKTDD